MVGNLGKSKIERGAVVVISQTYITTNGSLPTDKRILSSLQEDCVLV